MDTGVEKIRWWQWTLLSIGLGWALFYMNSAPVEPMDLKDLGELKFEEAILHAPAGENKAPWVKNLVVYPPTSAISGTNQTIMVTPVVFEVLAPKPGGAADEYVYQLSWFGAPIPYMTCVRRPSAYKDAATTAEVLKIYRSHLPPGIEKTYTLQADDTIESIAQQVYGRNDKDACDAITAANAALQRGRSIKDLIDAKKLRVGQALFIPWSPSENKTVRDWLDAAQGQYSWINYRWGWWKVPKDAEMIWMGGTILIVGIIWPIGLSFLKGAGLGRQAVAEQYDLSRFGKGKPTKAVAAVKAEMSDVDRAQLKEVQEALAASLKDGIGHAPAAPAGAQPSAAGEEKEFKTAPLEPSPALGQAEEKKEYEGQFYPVAKGAPHNKPNEPPPA